MNDEPFGQFRAALFDLDGTLIDTEGQYTAFWEKTGREYRSDIPDLALRIKGTTLTNILATYFPEPALQEFIINEVNAFESQMKFPFVEGAERFVRDLRQRGVSCAIVTSSDKNKLANVWRAMPDFLNLFDAILTADDFAASKPAPDCYLAAARRLSQRKEHCVVFEDALTGLMAGKNAGIYTIGLTTGNPREKITPLCDYVVSNFVGLDYDRVNELMLKSLHEGNPKPL